MWAWSVFPNLSIFFHSPATLWSSGILKANSHELTISVSIKYLTYLKAVTVRENEEMKWSHEDVTQQTFFCSGKRANVDFHITPCAHGACKLISSVVINKQLWWRSSTYWTFPRADSASQAAAKQRMVWCRCFTASQCCNQILWD